MQFESSPQVTALPRRVIGVAASAGGVEALQRLVEHLPADLDAAVCVVLHIPSTGRSLLAPILGRATKLTVVLATDGAPLRRGTVYVAPADHHLLIRADRIELSSGPRRTASAPPRTRCSARWRAPGARRRWPWCSPARSTTAPPERSPSPRPAGA